MTVFHLLRAAAAIALVSLLAAFPAAGQKVTTPAPGSSQRAAILDGLRPAIEAVMRGPVEFVVRQMNVDGEWAFVIADPQRPGGGAIDIARTGVANDGILDGLTVFALLRQREGRWHHVSDYIGPTDVAYYWWPDYYGVPPYIIGF